MFYTISALGFTVFLLVFGAYHFGMFQSRSPYVHQKISGALNISSEWVEIKPEGSLRLTGDYQEIGLYVEPPVKVVFDSPKSYGIRMPDGSLETPEVEVIDTEGNVVTTKFSGAGGTKTIWFRLPEVSKTSEYKAVRIRAKRQIQLDSVYWTGIIIKNMP